MTLTLTDFLMAFIRVKKAEPNIFEDAVKDRQLINYIVGKLMVITKGQMEPKVAMKAVNAIVDDLDPNTRTVDIKID